MFVSCHCSDVTVILFLSFFLKPNELWRTWGDDVGEGTRVKLRKEKLLLCFESAAFARKFHQIQTAPWNSFGLFSWTFKVFSGFWTSWKSINNIHNQREWYFSLSHEEKLKRDFFFSICISGNSVLKHTGELKQISYDKNCPSNIWNTMLVFKTWGV